MTKVNHIHSSSRFDRSDASLERAVRNYLSQASVVTMTEVNREGRERILRRVAKELNFTVITGDLSSRDDCAIIFDNDVFELVHGRTYTVQSKTYRTVDGRTVQPFGVATAVLRTKSTGRKTAWTVGHTPPSVEGRNGLDGSLRAIVWMGYIRNWRKHWNMITKLYSTDGLVVVADWNVNLKRRAFQTLFRTLFPSLKSAWGSGPFPAGGTHGRRLIDFTLYRGKIRQSGKPFLMKDDDSSDHRPYKEVLYL
jgi:hypothetical protein